VFVVESGFDLAELHYAGNAENFSLLVLVVTFVKTYDQHCCQWCQWFHNVLHIDINRLIYVFWSSFYGFEQLHYN